MWISLRDDARTSHVSSKLLMLLDVRPYVALLASCHLTLSGSEIGGLHYSATMSIEILPNPAHIPNIKRIDTHPSWGMDLLPGPHRHLEDSSLRVQRGAVKKQSIARSVQKESGSRDKAQRG